MARSMAEKMSDEERDRRDWDEIRAWARKIARGGASAPRRASRRTERSAAHESPAASRRGSGRGPRSGSGVERLEEARRRRVRVELLLQVGRHADLRLRLVGVVEPAVGLRLLVLAQPGRADAVGGDQRLDLLPVDPRPLAAAPARREALEEPVLVERLALAVDPAEAERDLERLGVRDALDPRLLLGDLQPDAVGALVLCLEPRLPVGGRRERALHQLGSSAPSCS